MNSDKNSNALEKQLKVLGQQVRINILKSINLFDKPLSFSALQKEVLGSNPNSINFSFHLNALKKVDFLSSTSEGYGLTDLGKNMLKSIVFMEKLLNAQNKTIMIRTSKYSKEPFDARKIEEFLIKEGRMEKFPAKQIAQQVEERLSKTKINYLTAPLMREYVNAVLIENGFENVRHELTRLGVPAFEVFKLFDSPNCVLDPDNFIKKLGSEASEQFLLLNLLPNHLADMYLSKEVALLHLNYWSLRPLGFYINSETILNMILKNNSNKIKELNKSKDYINLVLNFIDVLKVFKSYFSSDLLLGEFNNKFLFLFDSLKKEKVTFYLDILSSQILKFKRLGATTPSLSLDFCYNSEKELNEGYPPRFQIDKLFLHSLNKGTVSKTILRPPLIMFDYSIFKTSNLKNCLLSDFNSTFTSNIIFYNNEFSNLMNSTLIKVKNSKDNEQLENKVILDKILINLHFIAEKAKHDDKIFYELLQEKVKSIFEFFNYKKKLVKRKLKSSREWTNLSKLVFNGSNIDCIEASLKSVSFFGLNEAVKHHCGIEIDRIEKSESFALNILKLIKKLIREKNDEKNDYFVLSQPCDDVYSMDSRFNREVSRASNEGKGFSTRLLRTDSNQTLDRKISLFKKFEKIIDGGILFRSPFNSSEMSLENYFERLLHSNLPAFSI